MLPRGPMDLNLDTLPIGPLKLNFGRASRRSDGLILDVLPRGPFTLKFGRASQRSIEIEFGRAS